MRLVTLAVLGLTFWTCRSSNDDFDPFDKDFSFHNKMNISEYDTIWDSCGFWAFENDNKNGLKIFYGFLFDDMVGKGFSLETDKISTKSCDSLFYHSDYHTVLTDLLIQNPIDLEKVKPKLLAFGVTNIKIVSDGRIPFQLEITNSKNETFTAWLSADCDLKGNVVRYLYYTNSKDEENYQ